MRARIAPEPISTGLAALGDHRSRRAAARARAKAAASLPLGPESELPQTPLQPEADPISATSTFAAALLSSTHETPAEAKREQARKLRRAALPAQGSLALTDRRV
jgi:hypothetical protein